MKPALLVCLVALASLLNPGAVHAYLDPGSGSILLQVILGGIAGLVVAGKLFWARILDFLGIRKIQPNAHDSDPAE